MGEFNQRNKDRLAAWVAQQPRIRNPKLTIDPLQIQNPDHNNVVRCPVCFDIPRFPIISICNHILCNECFVKNFTSKIINRGYDYFTKCPECRTKLFIADVKTYSQLKVTNPNSPASAFYGSIRVLCDNAGCNQFISFDQLNDHEMFQCSYRKIVCPAKLCPAVGRPEQTLNHTLNCPLHSIWCGICYTRYSCVVYGHNCQMMLQRRVLMGIKCTKELLVGYGNHETGDILLPNDDKPTSLDLQAIQSINNLIRLKRGMSMFKLYGGPAEQDDPEVAEEGGNGAIELQPPALPAEVIPDVNLFALDENARLDPDFNYDFS
jgi:hypothetical protein